MCAQELPKVAIMLCFQIWSCQEWQDVCPRITKSGNNVLFPNLAHSGVARNGQKWQCNCFQIWLILELPGMAMVCAQEFPKVAIMFCFQIWLFPWSCQEWQCICFQIWLFPIPKSGNNVLFPNLALSMELPRMPKIGNVYVSLELPGMAMVCAQEFPKVAIKLIIILQGKKEIKNRTADYISNFFLMF